MAWNEMNGTTTTATTNKNYVVRTMDVCGSKWNSTKKEKQLDKYNENVIKTRVQPAPAPARAQRYRAAHNSKQNFLILIVVFRLSKTLFSLSVLRHHHHKCARLYTIFDLKCGDCCYWLLSTVHIYKL